jgi:cell cycle sensor histidine kinase DivJ
LATVEFPFEASAEELVANTTPRPDDPAGASAELGDALLWHGGWAGVTAAALIGLTATGSLQPASALALLAGAAPGAAAFWLRREDSPALRAALLAFWAGCCAAAAMLTGGVTGPLAAWCLAPAAAAAVFGTSSLLAEAGALCFAAAAIAALTGLAGLLPPPPAAPASFWLGLTGLSTTGLGLGAGLLLSRRRAGRRAQIRLAAEAGLERLLAEQPHLVLALDGDGRVLAAFGYAPAGVDGDALAGRRLAEAARADGAAAIADALTSARFGGAGECLFAPAAAPERRCALSVRRASDGRLAAVLRDATAQAQREAALETARDDAETLNAGKSRFLANMSHELRTPLNAVMGFSDVMRTKLFGELQPKYAEYADMIHDAGRHLLELINDVLDISKIEAARYELSREDIDAREPISAALRLTRLQADQLGVSLRGMLPAETLDAVADPRAIKQIVLNLVSNALKFTPAGGSVTVAAKGYGEDLEIVVSDTGVGIADADLERLGRPYEQAGDAAQKVRGTGLGLSLVRAFAELHGGGMSIESRLGEGTSVTVRMPVLTPAPAQPGPETRPGTAQVIAFKPPR